MNCFQEALLPILARGFGCEPSVFPILRVVGWREVLTAAQEKRSPGLFGGRTQEEMTRLYDIRWEAAASCSAPQAITELARIGPPICKVDRFYVPSDQRWYGRKHRAHSILIVEVSDRGVRYSDADYPFVPAFLSWDDLESALLREQDGSPHFARAVAGCRDLVKEHRAAIADDYRNHVAVVLATPCEVVAQAIEHWTNTLQGLDESTASTVGVDVVSFVNALAQSLNAGHSIGAVDNCAEWSEAVGNAARHLELCVTRTLTFVQTLRPRHLERVHEAFDRLRGLWQRYEAAVVADTGFAQLEG